MPHRPLVFDRAGARAIDDAAHREFGLSGAVLMENAAAASERECLRLLSPRPGDPTPTWALVVCGPGNNGGDGFALARRLHNAGVVPRCALVGPEPRSPESLMNLRCARAMGIPIDPAANDPQSALDAIVSAHGPPAIIVDALLGTGAAPDRPPSGAIARAVECINRLRTANPTSRILSIDIPTGLDCDSGTPIAGGPCVRADVTVTFCGLKQGFLNPASRPHTGEVIVGDIGAPRELLERLALRAEQRS